MKDMNEFRQTVREKAEKKAAEEKLKKLRLKKFATLAACMAIIIVPALIAIGTSSPSMKGDEKYFDTSGTPSIAGAETLTPNYSGGGSANHTEFDKEATEEAATSIKYTTTRPYSPPQSAATTTWEGTSVVVTTPLWSGTEPVQTSASRTHDTTMSQQTETAGAESGERADVTVGGKTVILKKGMSYAEICKLLGGEGRAALGAPIYKWSCGDGVTLTVRFDLTGDADTPYPERMKAVYFTVIR